MPQFLGGVDVQAAASGLAAIGVVVGLAVAGFRQGVKKVREDAADLGGKFVGGTIMGSMEVTMLTERLREHSEVTRESIAAMRDNTAALGENAHQLERLRDRMA